ncbi:hypothetical protein FRX31_005847 [Thalictrum thalictroides]|uniref:Uncharacterized protein n=1 Tax=Thalictrum thalictroides TaxID=46969 RepID=A0A7J6X4C4_THATH|nr:hypothetical protein FRX31_005847 [Thalictrum thalictroides]
MGFQLDGSSYKMQASPKPCTKRPASEPNEINIVKEMEATPINISEVVKRTCGKQNYEEYRSHCKEQLLASTDRRKLLTKVVISHHEEHRNPMNECEIKTLEEPALGVHHQPSSFDYHASTVGIRREPIRESSTHSARKGAEKISSDPFKLSGTSCKISGKSTTDNANKIVAKDFESDHVGESLNTFAKSGFIDSSKETKSSSPDNEDGITKFLGAIRKSKAANKLK